MEFGFGLSIIVLIFGLLGMTLFSVGTIKDMITVAWLGVIGLFITAAIAMGVGLCIVEGSAQLWKTSELKKLTDSKSEPYCYIFGGNKLCGEFIYEDKYFRYISNNKDGKTITIENKEKN